MVVPESPSVSVSRRVRGDAGRTVVWVRGEHDIATRTTLAVAIARAAQRDSADVLVDLSMVTFMDAAIVGAIVGSRNRLLTRGGQVLEVRSPSPQARRVLELCGLTGLIDVGMADLVRPRGAAPALSSWIELPSTGSRGRANGDTGAVIEVTESESAFENDRGGP